MTKKGPNVHVVRAPNEATKYVVKEAGNPKPLTKPTTQAESIKKAIPRAKANESDVVIHGRDGKIRDRDSYGSDPVPPKDRKH